MESREIAIKAEDISKCYRIGLKEQTHDNFAAALMDFVTKPIKNYRKYRSLYRFDDIDHSKDGNSDEHYADIIWALKDISFTVKRGEVMGIIGRNGAGKSTLLKIFSRITPPTKGIVDIRGRVSSLLEVGTGFHPELTGRENIYLNGTVLGMKKKEVDNKFDEIVAFSEVEKFLDTPVKRYSSGMRVRMAFSVAAHLDSEILMIDEVLAVGDLAFQKKCLEKMESVTKEGRTVLFVSHNVGIISELCDRCILLEDGAISQIGQSREVVNQYLSQNCIAGEIDLRDWSTARTGSGPMRCLYLKTQGDDGQIRSHFEYKETISFNIGISGKTNAACIIGVSIRSSFGQLILHFSNIDDSSELMISSDTAEIQMRLKENVLNDGTYYITVWLGDGFNIMNDRVHNCLSFTVASAHQGRIVSQSPVRLPAEWRVRTILHGETGFARVNSPEV